MAEQRYVYGNTARELERGERYEHARARQREKNSIRNKERALSIDVPFLIMFFIAAVATLIICVNYLRLQSAITTSIKNIEKQEQMLESLKNENDALESSINTSVNLDYVYKVATEDLGMVYAKKNQIITYDKTESEYVRQYDNIP